MHFADGSAYQALNVPAKVRRTRRTIMKVYSELLAAARERPGMDGSSMPPPLELTVYEEAPEVLARQLLLLSIALDFEAHIPHNSHHEDSHFPARHSAHAPGASA